MPGSDADLVLIDTRKEVRMTPEVLHATSDFTWFDGWSMKGWPTMTMSRGAVVVQDGELLSEKGHGKYLRRYLADPAKTSLTS